MSGYTRSDGTVHSEKRVSVKNPSANSRDLPVRVLSVVHIFIPASGRLSEMVTGWPGCTCQWLLPPPPPDSRQSEKGTRCRTSGTVLAFKTAPEEVSHHSETWNITILRSYGELGLELPTQVESKIERKSEQNSVHDLLLISALQSLVNTEAGHAPEGQSSMRGYRRSTAIYYRFE